jgi:RNA 2',3'-cyclic 3'-phosphodiesterase
VSRGATARLFVAVDPPPDIRTELAEWARRLRSATRAAWPLRVLEPDSLHLTLCFLGTRPVAEIAALAAALAPAAGPLGELRVGAPLLLPPRRPRSLAVEIHDDSGALVALHARLSAELTRVSGWQPERRRLRPHVTLARMGRGVRGAPAPETFPPTPALTFVPPSLILYRSRLDRAGARYEPLAECELAEAG